jgi:hypothetical protein
MFMKRKVVRIHSGRGFGVKDDCRGTRPCAPTSGKGDACQFVAKAGRDGALEMLKMKIDPTMCKKTQETMTNCHGKWRAFYRKMHELREKLQDWSGLLGRNAQIAR